MKEDLVSVAQTDQLDKLRHLLDLEIAQNPQFLTSPSHLTTPAIEAACCAAARSNNPAALDILLDSGCSITLDPILDALHLKHTAILDCILAHNWDINSTFSHFDNALIVAARERDVELVQFLLSRGAKPNSKSFANPFKDAIETAAFTGSIPVADALLNAGAVLKGGFALRTAACWGHVAMVAFLLERGAAIDEIPINPYIMEEPWEPDEKNALCEAAWRGQAAVVEFLLEKGADPSIRDTKGRSALELAKAGVDDEFCVKLAEPGGHESCVKLLDH
ncbi:ankyrin repeat domain-containing protein [Aspergillus affinis]|uniref:ankyrin repeat domain-containing protein n=1 Tax=Aspergillus affinis TaxID=1070780 RepID=UPI0022FF2164|nr:ankyrin [Aspergillus affinis]KAI9034890.1 ankyrin [Aspergillus affinis]